MHQTLCAPSRFEKLGAVDPGLERLIYGYDVLVLVPELTRAEMVK